MIKQVAILRQHRRAAAGIDRQSARPSLIRVIGLEKESLNSHLTISRRFEINKMIIPVGDACSLSFTTN